MKNRKLVVMLIFLMLFQVFTAGIVAIGGGAGQSGSLGDRAAELDTRIGALDYSSENFLDEVSVTRSVYEALPLEERPFVNSYATLLTAEADIAAAATVISAIDLLDHESEIDTNQVTVVRALYDALAINQKLLVSNYADLQLAEATNDQAAITAARKAVEAAEASARGLVGDGTDTLEEISVAMAVYHSASSLVIALPTMEIKSELEQRLVIMKHIIDKAQQAVLEGLFGFGLMSLEGDFPEPPALVEHGKYQQCNETLGSDIEVCLITYYTSDNIVLGMTKVVDVQVTNNRVPSESSDGWAFNLGIELLLGDGLQTLEHSNEDFAHHSRKTLSVEDEVKYGENAAYYEATYWKDIKNLAPGEVFTFPIEIESMEYYRELKNIGEEPTFEKDPVPFGKQIAIRVNVFDSGDDPRVIVGPPATVGHLNVAEMTLKTVPFTFIPSPAHKVVKGAGKSGLTVDSTCDSGACEWGDFNFSFTIVNNNITATTFSDITSITDGWVQIYNLNAPGGSTAKKVLANYESDERSFGWTDLVVERGGEAVLTFTGAFLDFNMSTDEEEEDNENAGAVQVRDRFIPISTVTYEAAPSGGGTYPERSGDGSLSFYYNLAIAKDITIDKSVTSNTEFIGYGTELEYTITVKTNEYYDVSDVVVKDTIGDGQNLKVGQTIIKPSEFIERDSSANDNGTGTWNLEWELNKLDNGVTVHGDVYALPQRSTYQFSYVTVINENWSLGGKYSGEAIYAGDYIVNEATVSGKTTVSGPVSDTSYTEVRVNTPGISEIITGHNGDDYEDNGGLIIDAAVGDKIEFTITYDATKVNAQQSNVEIRDYLPLGTVPVEYFDNYVSNYDEETGKFVGVPNGPEQLEEYKVTIDGTDYTPDYYPNNNMLVWTFPNLEKHKIFDLVVDVIVLNDDEYVTKEKGDKNLVVLSYQNSPKRVESTRESVTVNYAEPVIVVTREVRRDDSPTTWGGKGAPIIVNGEEIVWVKLTIENTGNGTAYAVDLTENIPDDFAVISGKIITPIETEYTYIENNRKGSFKLNSPLPAGDSITIEYWANIIKDIGAGKQISQSSMISYLSHTSKGREYEHGGDGPDVTMGVPGPTITYDLVHYGSSAMGETQYVKFEVSNTDYTTVRVGDWVVYKVTVKVPDHDMAYNPEIDIILPSNHSLDEIFKNDYIPASFTGTELIDPTNYTIEGSTVKINSSSMPLSAGAEYVFYIRTIVGGVDQSEDNYTETQYSSAKFTWRDLSLTGISRTIGTPNIPITVKIPELKGEWYYWDKVAFVKYNDNPLPLAKDEVQDMQFVITNIGQNTAYHFKPMLTVPVGFLITDAPGSEAILHNDTVATYPMVNCLGPGSLECEDDTDNPIAYTITVRMVDVPGSGASFDVTGNPGAYYSTPYAQETNSNRELEEYTIDDVIAELGVPNVTIQNKIIDTTYTEFTDSDPWIRPGDVMTYELVITVPKGTRAFDLEVEDTIFDHEKFEFIHSSKTLKWNQAEPDKVKSDGDTPRTISVDDIEYDQNGKLTVNLGNSPKFEDVYNEEEVTYTITFKLRAKPDGTKPTGDDHGSFDNGNRPSFVTTPFITSAKATWFTDVDDDPDRIEISTVDQEIDTYTTSIQVKQPDVNISVEKNTYTMSDDAFKNIEYTITNSGNAPSVIHGFEVQVPFGFDIDEASISDEGVFLDTATNKNEVNRVVWEWPNPLSDPPSSVLELGTPESEGNSNIKVLTFDLKKTSVIGAEEEGLKLIAKLDHYYSTEAPKSFGDDGYPTTTGDITSKKYNLAPIEAKLNIASLELTVELIANSNGNNNAPRGEVRPGDILIYELTITTPGSSQAYGVHLTSSGIDNQTIIGVESSDGLINPDINDHYLIGDGKINAETKFRVITRVKTATELASTSFLPEIGYYSLIDTTDTLKKKKSDKALIQNVVEPKLEINIEALPVTLEGHEDSSAVTITLDSDGGSPAYATEVEINITHNDNFAYQTIGQGDVFAQFSSLNELDEENNEIKIGDDTLNVIANKDGILTLKWIIDEIAADASKTLQFIVKANKDTDLEEILTFETEIIEYNSLPNADVFDTAIGTIELKDTTPPISISGYLTNLEFIGSYFDRLGYNPEDPSKLATVGLEGSFELSEADPTLQTRFAGQLLEDSNEPDIASFAHVLKNTGAGKDSYSITVTGLELLQFTENAVDETLVVLHIEGEKVLEGTVNTDGKLEWTCVTVSELALCDIDETHTEVTLSLDANEEVNIGLHVEVSEHISFRTTPSLPFTITVTSKSSTVDPRSKSVKDTVDIRETKLDGWSGELTYDERDGWDLPEYEHGKQLELHAVTANHVNSVFATIEDAPSSIEQPLRLVLVNGGDVIDDKHWSRVGHKVWKYTEEAETIENSQKFTLLQKLDAGEYDITFRSYLNDDGIEGLDETDTTSELPLGDNNAIKVIEPSLKIGITTDETEFTNMDDIIRLVTVTVNNIGESIAHDTLVKLDFGLQDELYNFSDFNVDPELIIPVDESDGGGYTWHIPAIAANTGEAVLTFKVSPFTTTEVDKKIVIEAAVIEYQTLAEQKGIAYNPTSVKEEVEITIVGGHTLGPVSQSLRTTASQEVFFIHTLTNIGAGHDTFILDLSGPFDTSLFVGPSGASEDEYVLVSSGEWNNVENKMEWVIEEGYEHSDLPALSLAAGEAVKLKLVMSVPGYESTEVDEPMLHILSATAVLNPNPNSITNDDTITVIAPSLLLTLTPGQSDISSFGETVEFNVIVDNQGEHDAHTAKIVITLAEELELVDYDDEIISVIGRTLTWTIEQLEIEGKEELTFKVNVLPSTKIGAVLDVTAQVMEYFALPEDLGNGEKYPGSEEEIATITIKGNHTLEDNSSASVSAGQIAKFATHILHNKGAGQDTFLIEVSSEDIRYPGTLFVDEEEVATISWNGTKWTWTFKDEGYKVGGSQLGIVLDSGETADIRLHVQVPEDAAHGPSAVYDYTLVASGQLSEVGVNGDVKVTNTLTITGEDLDGWSGSQSYEALFVGSNQEVWKQPKYGLVDSVFFNAVSAVNVNEITAELTVDVKEADGSTSVKTLDKAQLVLVDSDYIADGYKLWAGTTRLPIGVVSGEYNVTFEALDAQGIEWTDTIDGPKGSNNPIAVETQLTIQGTITDAGNTNKDPIGAAKVVLYDPINSIIVAETETKDDGTYEFKHVDVANYKLVVSKDGYSNATQYFYALPEYGSDKVIVDAQLSPYYIILSASPTSILGDGKSTTELTAIIKGLDGEPLEGAKATFYSPKGKFIGPTTVLTDEHGVAKTTFQSDAVGGTASVSFPVSMEVEDTQNDLYARTQIVITFEPGAVIGVVSEMVDDGKGGKEKQYIAGAVVTVTNETIGFYGQTVTDELGEYVIGVPVGDLVYDVAITKPVRIGDVDQNVTFYQTARVGEMDAGQYEKFPAVNAGSGMVLLQSPDGKTSKFNEKIYELMRVSLKKKGSNVSTEVTMDVYGAFNVQGLDAGTYDLIFTLETTIEDEEGNINNVTLTIAEGSLEIKDDGDDHGEMNITTELVDPYGDVRSVKSPHDLIEGAKITLYYADGLKQDQEVILPALAGFDPFNNLSPVQITDVQGQYAWMVYPETNYYITAIADGYYDYKSEVIEVGWDIVRHDIWMTPIPPPVSPGGGGFFPPPLDEDESEEVVTDIDIDLAIDISGNQRGYMENSLIELTVDYINRSSEHASNVVITIDLPDNTTGVDLNGGTLTDDGTQVIWVIDQLPANHLDSFTFTIQAGKLTSGEQELSTKATITSDDKLINLNDDVSKLNLMLFSNEFGVFSHNRYIIGYPDGEFKPSRNITRAEIATIFARILQLRGYVDNETLYSDVTQDQWFADAIEAVTKRGLFQGYEDGTFRPNQPITRAELTAVIAKFLEFEDRPPVVVNFSDLTGHWASNIIEYVRRNRIAEGFADGSFKPNNNLVRSEAVTMINRLMYRGPLYGAEASYTDTTDSNHWAFGDVEESTRSHEATRLPDGSEQFVREIDTTLDF